MLLQQNKLNIINEESLSKLRDSFTINGNNENQYVSYHLEEYANAMAQIVADLLSSYDEVRVQNALYHYSKLNNAMISLESMFESSGIEVNKDFTFVQAEHDTPEEHQTYAYIHTLLNNLAHDLTPKQDDPNNLVLPDNSPSKHLTYALTFLNYKDRVRLMHHLEDVVNPETGTLAGIREVGAPSIPLLGYIVSNITDWKAMGDKRWEFAEILKETQHLSFHNLEDNISHLMARVAENPEYGIQLTKFVVETNTKDNGKWAKFPFLGNSKESQWLEIFQNANDEQLKKILPLSSEKLEHMNYVLEFEAFKSDLSGKPSKNWWAVEEVCNQIERYYPSDYKFYSIEQKQEVDNRHQELKAHLDPEPMIRAIRGM